MAQTAESLFFRMRHMLSLPTANFNALMSKWSFAFYTLAVFICEVLAVSALGIVWGSVAQYLSGAPSVSMINLLRYMIANPVYQIALLVLLFTNGRSVLFRMDDKEV